MNHIQNFTLEEHSLSNQDQISDQIEGELCKELLMRANTWYHFIKK